MRKEALLWEKLDAGRVRCRLCSHHCGIDEGGFGICGMRQNTGGSLYTYAYGDVIASGVDPIEKKPLYHFLPGSYAYSIAVMGCNFCCSFCQNWNISRLSAKNGDVPGVALSPEDIVRKAVDAGCDSISYTYTEPTVFFEYAYDTAKIAREKGLRNSFVTNGFMTKEAIDTISPCLDAANVDLKFFNDDSYRAICKARLQPVLDSIKHLKANGIWVEVTTLIVPGENDSDKELRDIASFLAGVGKEIPWHISRFHPDYQLTDISPTPLETMKKAAKIGATAGLKYIYLGNVPARGETICPGCGVVLIGRPGFSADISSKFSEDGKCRECGTIIEGIWK